MWPDADTTQELLTRAGAGEDAAVNALIERHRDALRRMVAGRMDRAMSRRVDASDIVQEVLIEAHRRLPEYLQSGSMPFHLWLRQMAQDRMIDQHRRHHAQRRDVKRERNLNQSGRSEQSSLNLAAQLCDLQLTPAAAALRKELEVRFWEAVDQLEEQDREMVLMRHQEHLDNREVAEVLGLTPAAAGMRYLRALRKLKSLLATPPSRS